MRRDVLDLRQFYASDLGRAARAMVGRKVLETWGDARGLDVLALGYATPFLATARHAARRVVGAMPAQQGVEIWPAGERNLTTLVGEDSLPFANALFDRILVVHGIEESPDPIGLLREAELEPSGWTRALYVPPLNWLAGWAEGFEQTGSRLWPGFAGLLLMEAVKQTFAVKPRGLGARARRARPLLTPAPISQAPISQARGGKLRHGLLEAGRESLSVTDKSNRKAAP